MLQEEEKQRASSDMDKRGMLDHDDGVQDDETGVEGGHSLVRVECTKDGMQMYKHVCYCALQAADVVQHDTELRFWW